MNIGGGPGGKAGIPVIVPWNPIWSAIPLLPWLVLLPLLFIRRNWNGWTVVLLVPVAGVWLNRLAWPFVPTDPSPFSPAITTVWLVLSVLWMLPRRWTTRQDVFDSNRCTLFAIGLLVAAALCQSGLSVQTFVQNLFFVALALMLLDKWMRSRARPARND